MAITHRVAAPSAGNRPPVRAAAIARSAEEQAKRQASIQSRAKNKRTLMSDIKRLPLWKKLVAGGAALLAAVGITVAVRKK